MEKLNMVMTWTSDTSELCYRVVAHAAPVDEICPWHRCGGTEAVWELRITVPPPPSLKRRI